MSCVFCDIASGAIPTEFLHRDDQVIAFRDMHPQAPTHVLVVPVRHIQSAQQLQAADAELLIRMVTCAQELARTEGVAETGYRLVFNVGHDGNQTVMHIHMHLLGGRVLGWPPG